MYKSQLIKTIAERGFIYQNIGVDNLDSICASRKIRGYVGFDATASSLHVGSLAVIMIGKWMQLLGHHPIFLVGGGTTKIGDPAWRNKDRPILSNEKISSNIEGIKKVFSNIVSFDSDNSALLVNNADWIDEIKYISFLRDIGVHFSINRMLSLEHIKSRLENETHLSFIEFNYILLQAFDFLKLFQNQECILQFGGSDQWANILSGVDLIKKIEHKEAYAFTTPLVTTASGVKMGKTEKGAVWLNPDLLSPYEYWQFWRNVDDDDVEKFLKIFTLLPMDEISYLASFKGYETNQAKIVLADQATEILHGKDKLLGIHSTVKSIFDRKGEDDSSLPSKNVSYKEIKNGFSVLDAIISLQFCRSKSEGRQFIRNRIVFINDKIVENELTKLMEMLTDNDLEKSIKISVGKKKHGVLKVN